MIRRTCENCGAVFHVDVARRAPRACNTVCAQSLRRNGSALEPTCAVCLTVYTRAGRRESATCTRDCARILRALQRGDAVHWPSSPCRVCECITCGRLFVGRTRHERVYCGCRGRKPVTLVVIRTVHSRDGGVCHLCTHLVRNDVDQYHPWAPSVDHVVPLALGGTSRLDNLTTAHRFCNMVRGTRPLPAVSYPPPPVVWTLGAVTARRAAMEGTSA